MRSIQWGPEAGAAYCGVVGKALGAKDALESLDVSCAAADGEEGRDCRPARIRRVCACGWISMGAEAGWGRMLAVAGGGMFVRRGLSLALRGLPRDDLLPGEDVL